MIKFFINPYGGMWWRLFSKQSLSFFQRGNRLQLVQLLQNFNSFNYFKCRGGIEPIEAIEHEIYDLIKNDLNYINKNFNNQFYLFILLKTSLRMSTIEGLIKNLITSMKLPSGNLV